MNRAWLLVTGSCMAALGCRSPTQITVEVDTNLDCSQITSTAIAVGNTDALVAKSAASSTLHCEAGHIGALVVVPSANAEDEVAIRVVSGVQGRTAEACTASGFRGGCIVARRSLHFVPHTPLRVPVLMSATCVDIACDAPGTFATCVNGACVAAEIPDPAACTGDGCGEGVLGAGGVPSADAGLDGSHDGAIDTGSDASNDAGTGPSDGAIDAQVDAAPHAPTWVPMASSTSIGFAPRADAIAVWTGSRMFVWGGAVATSFATDGASYDPVADSWELLPATQLGGRQGNTVIWSGTEMIVWGGAPINGNAGRLDPKTGTWRLLPDAPVSGRHNFASVWAPTSGEMLVWGGDNDVDYLADGAAYSPTRPAGSEWRVLEPSPLSKRSAVQAAWNGTSMVIFGGGGCGSTCDDAASYDPVKRVWTVITNVPSILDARQPEVAIATGPSLTLATFFGSSYDGALRTTGASYDAVHNLWSPIDGLGTAVLPSPNRYGAAFFWGAGKLWMWGGYGDGDVTKTRADGASFDPSVGSGGTWSSMAPGGPSARGDMSVVWTGSEGIVWGGQTASDTLLDDGARFRP